MKLFIGISIHILILLGYIFAAHATLCILACYWPFLRWIPGYDPDPLGSSFALMFLMPYLGILGILALIFKRYAQISRLTGLSALAYVVPAGLAAWAGDTGFPLFTIMPVWLRNVIRSSGFTLNCIFLSLGIILFVMACIRYGQILRGATNNRLQAIGAKARLQPEP